MAIRIRESITKVWASQTERQFGIDKPVRIQVLSPPEEIFLAMLELGIADGQLATAAKLAGLDIDRANEIVAELSEVLEDLSPPLAKAEAAHLPTPLRGSFEKRQKSVVYIPQLDRLGRLVTHALAHAGVGKIVVGDGAPVSESDCGRLGYPRTQLGLSKLAVIRSETANSPSNIKLDNRMQWADYSEIDIALVVASGAFQPTDYQRWVSLGAKHIGVCFSDRHVLITSVIRENDSCLGCRELNRWARDESRKLICGQVAGASGVKDSLSILFAASVAAQRVIRSIDFDETSSDLQFWSDGKIISVSEQANPSCGCQQALGEID